MAIDDYRIVPKLGIKKMVEEALKKGLIISNPIEHYSIEEIKELSELAKENNLIFSIKEETSNVYQGILINLVQKTSVKECSSFIDHL